MTNYIYLIVVPVLFLLAYFSKRRFGMLGLGLAAGSLLSSYWSDETVKLAVYLGAPSGLVVMSASVIVLTLLPSLILLLHGSSYSNKTMKLIGSIAFAILGLAFLIEPLGMVLTMNTTDEIYRKIVSCKELIIGFGLALAVVDTMFTFKTKDDKDKKHLH